MAGNIAAGLLMCRIKLSKLEYFLIHPGGPYYRNKDFGVWSIPKGIPEGRESLIITAQREFFEETGITPISPFFEIGSIKQKAGKIVHAWTFLGEWNYEDGISSNNFSIIWPPGSGKRMEFPEADKAKWMDYTEASKRINPHQISLLERAKEIYLPIENNL